MEEPMDDRQLMERITLDPAVMTGKPLIRGTRLTVEHILGLRASGATDEEILDEYSGLSPEDLRACYLFATRALADTSFVPLPVGGA
jgi:uncharacterized protein (DUF433 family)